MGNIIYQKAESSISDITQEKVFESDNIQAEMIKYGGQEI